MNKRNIGSLYEEKAVEYLKNNGFTVIVKNSDALRVRLIL